MLSKENFGIFTAAFNVFSVVYLFSGLGISSGILYYGSRSDHRSERKSIYRFSLIFGIASEAVLSLAMLLYALIAESGIAESKRYIFVLVPLPFIAFIFDYFAIILRTEKDNKKYSYLLNINTCLYAVLAVAGSMAFGIIGTIIGRYLAYAASCVVGIVFCREHLHIGKENKTSLDKKTKSVLLKYSVKAGLTSALNNILYRLDVFIIATLVANASILASYKVGTQIPENMNFIPQSIMVFILPIIVEKSGDKAWLREKIKKLYLVMFLLIGMLSIVMFITAPWLITTIWGNNYKDAVACYRILTVSFFFLSTFRLTSTNILLSLGKAGFTLVVSIVTGIMNLLLDILLTLKYGSIGSAYATMIVTIFAALLSFPYVIVLIYKKGETVSE